MRWQQRVDALDDRVEADLLGVVNAVGEVGEGLAVVEIRGVNDVSASAELSGEGEAPGRQSLRMMKEQKLGHLGRQPMWISTLSATPPSIV